MATVYDITQQKIAAEAAACVERKRDAGRGFLGITLKPRRAYEGPCQAEAQAKYAGEIAAQQAESMMVEANVNDALLDTLQGGNKSMIIGVAILLFLIIVLIIVF